MNSTFGIYKTFPFECIQKTLPVAVDLGKELNVKTSFYSFKLEPGKVTLETLQCHFFFAKDFCQGLMNLSALEIRDFNRLVNVDMKILATGSIPSRYFYVSHRVSYLET